MRQEIVTERDNSPVEVTVSAANVQSVRVSCSHGPMGRPFRKRSCRNGSQSRGCKGGFTLAELLITVGVLVLLVLLFTQLLNSAATITTLGHKQMDADSQARQLLDRMAVDFGQMVKRADVDYYLKSPSSPQSGNDQVTFYTALPGYFATSPSPAPSYTGKSSVSLVSYRVNSDGTSASYNRTERLAKGLAWNGVSASWIPVMFLPQTISSNWPSAVSTSAADGDYEIIGAQTFRFEYYYLLKNGNLSTTPWDTTSGHTSVSGMQDVAAIIVDIAAIDSKSKALLSNSNITTLIQTLADYNGQVPGALIANWRSALDRNTSLPRPALSGIRLYERYFYLSPPTLLAAPTPVSGATPTATPIP
jgi:type II secretory pathway pseudopilin PulG